jgi:hypothetical protein
MQNNNVRDLISQLNRLQLQRTDLIARITRAANNEQEPDRIDESESEAHRTEAEFEAFRLREAESEAFRNREAESERQHVQEPRILSIEPRLRTRTKNSINW